MSEGNALIALIDCVNFSAMKHSTQRRLDPEKTPYINHPIGVARILAKEGGISDLATLQAAILHDTVEDTDTTIEEIEEHFGKEVRDIVADVTDDKTLHWKERKRLQIVHSPFICPKAKLVKLADKLYNLRDLEKSTPEGWTEERVQIYFEWSAKVINGIRGNNEVLEKELDKLFTKRDIVIEKE
ncbi:guanosine-3',5'-bis(diphosphate) 3'-pyrophosphohydrolase MESH1-like [Asterias rubens]|uniref:guanosine-3',5'-bis(diphosphate) 3'-pyrophosphohydrolase MESH1-like n=1 Tax=Asterias rubens TaxID=7604 RepID=UPI00145534B9|nr:guanosine-3',5'-bis(diphosphate) 3'-pyrophosphohydrolase MESH1-like [Asterias rubens]